MSITISIKQINHTSIKKLFFRNSNNIICSNYKKNFNIIQGTTKTDHESMSEKHNLSNPMKSQNHFNRTSINLINKKTTEY